MWLLKLVWKNMWRNKHRTTITIAAIYFAVILSVVASSLQDGVFDNLIKGIVGYYNGYIQVHKQGYWDEQILDNTFKDSNQLRQKIIQQDNLTGVTPRLESFALASSTELTKGCLVIGIDPDSEDKITALREKVVEGHYLTSEDKGVLLAEGLAKRLKLHLYDTLVVMGQGYHGAIAAGKYRINGIVKFGLAELNDQSLYLSLPAAQELYSADGLITSLVLALDNPKQMNATAKAVQSSIGTHYETMTWEEMMPEVEQHIRTDNGSMYIIQGILYLLICFGIFGTLVMMMVERKYEMGMLVAIGMKKVKLMQLLLMESLLTVLSGCMLGILTSIPIVFYLYKYPIQFRGKLGDAYVQFGFEPIFPASMDATVFITQGLIVLALGMILSIYPLLKVVRLDPVTAMKK